MLDFFSEYAPHGYCLLWNPALVWTHVLSDILITIAYFSIPVVLITFLRRRPDLDLGRVSGLFAVFILSCGFTHLMGVWNLWHGNYGVEALAKAVTAVASVPTAITLWRLLPSALALPSPAMLQERNHSLTTVLAERDTVLDRLLSEVAHREQVEAALVQSKKIEAIGQLTGGIAHDFNNLLQSVKGYIELIGLFPHQTTNVREWAENASEGVERGTKLTGQLLTFSRQQRLQAEAICLGAMLRGMDELLRNSVGPRVAIDLQISGDLGVVMSDKNQLELAVLNLAINARDAMPAGGSLLIAAERRGDCVTISVQDDGEGMSDEVAEHAFEPFFTTKEAGRGTGLGLSTVYGVAQQSGGSVTLTSRPQLGTTVCITLPRVEPASPCPAATHLTLVPQPTKGTTAMILVVDDDDKVRGAVVSMLHALGHEVSQANCGQAAIEQLERSTFDLLLLDFAMPCMNGAEIAQRAIEINPRQRILFLTGFADSEALDAALHDAKAGHARVLKKPIGPTELTIAIDSMLCESVRAAEPQWESR